MSFFAWSRYSVLFFFIAGINIFEISAQIVSPLFRHFTTSDGLPSSEVYFAAQDKMGIIWFGTDRGITRFDGYEFRTLTYKDGLTDNTVFKLMEDAKGRLWMLTYSGRIFYYEAGKIHPYKYNNIIVESNQGKVPSGFFIDSLENVSIALQSQGELLIDTNGIKKWRFVDSDSAYFHYLIDEPVKNKMLVSIFFPPTKAPKIKIVHVKGNLIDTISLNSPFADRFFALRLKNDKLIFAIGNLLYEESNDSVKFLTKFAGNVLSLTNDLNNRLWVGTETGVYVFNDFDLTSYTRRYLEKSNITYILQDNEGGYWFNTLDDGIFYMPGYGIETIQFTAGIIQKPVCLSSDFKSAIYAGCWSGSIVKIKDNNATLVYSGSEGLNLPILNLSSLPADEKIYISRSYPGYFLNNQFTPFKIIMKLGVKTNFIRRSDGNLYCAGSSFVMKIKNDSIIPIGSINQRINCIMENMNRELLIGTNRGVFVYNDQSKSITSFRKELNDVRVDDIKWVENNLFVATKGKGLLVLMKDSILKIDESKGLCSDLVNKIFVTGNDVWCTSNKGISHIVLNNIEKFKYTITNIQSNDGLLSDEINDITLLNDTIFVATNTGISYFSNGVDFVNHTPPPVYITSLRVSNSDVSFTSEKEFSHDHNDIHISFNGISYRSKEKILYKYQLMSGRDTLSSFTSNREVEFLSLHPGNYTFEVSARNNSGIWSTQPASFSFSINPAWWQTWWFRLIILLTGFAGVYAIYKNRVRKLKHNFEIERRQASLQLTAMRAQMNPHFIFNVMNSIRNYMQNHDMKSAEKYLTSFSRLVRYTLDNSEVQEVTLEEELQALRNYLELEKQRIEHGFDFNIVCEEGIDLNNTMLLSMLLQPFVENSIKHGISRMVSGGKILIDIRNSKGTIIIAIEDNGIGIQAASNWNNSNRENHISHGTSISFERIHAYNKVYNKKINTRIINLMDNDGKSAGTRVEIEI